MKYACTVRRAGPDEWRLRHASDDLGEIEVAAPTRDEALEKMRGEIRYRLELCPCTGETYQHVAIELVDA